MRIMGVRLRMRFMPLSSLATAASTSVMMLPGPMALTRTPCGAIASAMDLEVTCIEPLIGHLHSSFSVWESMAADAKLFVLPGA